VLALTRSQLTLHLILHEDESTSPPETLANAAAKGSGTKGKDVTSSHGEHGYTFVPQFYFFPAGSHIEQVFPH
jgi:hypothetical protein